MKILTTEYRRKADDFTINSEPISSIDLMERAAVAATECILKKYFSFENFAIFCGTGNNGGDGLVIARLLSNAGKNVVVYFTKISANQSPDNKINFDRLQNTNVKIKIIDSFYQLTDDLSDFVIIDALLGSGLSKPATGLAAQTIEYINSTKKLAVIAIDIPSGLFGERNTYENQPIINANFTVTFQFPFISFLFPQNNQYVGDFEVVPIGISPQYIKEVPTNFYFLDKNDIANRIKKRYKFSHKGNFGHGLLLAGGYGRMGAAILAAKAAHRSGIGLLTVHTPTKCVDIVQISSPESLISIDKDQFSITEISNLDKYNAIAIGPAIGFETETINLISRLFISNKNKKFVIDADAITITAKNQEILDILPQNSILTPHPKELERLIGHFDNDYDRLMKQIEFSQKYNVIVLQKGKYTAISTPEGRVFFNNTGNNGLAKGGSGDVLTGIILSLLAQDYEPTDAAIIGAWIHGLAADLAIEQISPVSLLPTDVIDYLSKAFATFEF